MHDLVIGPSTYVFQNPHLRIEYEYDASMFQLAYVDGSLTPWERGESRPRQVDALYMARATG